MLSSECGVTAGGIGDAAERDIVIEKWCRWSEDHRCWQATCRSCGWRRRTESRAQAEAHAAPHRCPWHVDVISARLWRKVDRRGPSECWPWTGAVYKRGERPSYGILDVKRPRKKRLWTHRLAWELSRGPIPTGLCVCHHCDNPPCCNPAHLFLGTLAENNRDRHAKGRSRGPRGDANWQRQNPRRGAEHPRARMTIHLRDYILAELAAGRSQQSIADEIGFAQTTISKIALGRHFTTRS